MSLLLSGLSKRGHRWRLLALVRKRARIRSHSALNLVLSLSEAPHPPASSRLNLRTTHQRLTTPNLLLSLSAEHPLLVANVLRGYPTTSASAILLGSLQLMLMRDPAPSSLTLRSLPLGRLSLDKLLPVASISVTAHTRLRTPHHSLPIWRQTSVSDVVPFVVRDHWEATSILANRDGVRRLRVYGAGRRRARLTDSGLVGYGIHLYNTCNMHMHDLALYDRSELSRLCIVGNV